MTPASIRSIVSKILSRLRKPGAPPRRFVLDSAAREGALLGAAREYVRRKDEDTRAWLARKPFDPNPRNPAYFTEMYQVLNLVEAMRVSPRGRILEVGSGPGWVSEILGLLDFEVVGVEPAPDMIAIAERRLAGTASHYRLAHAPAVSFVCAALEHCELEAGSFDAVLFHEALHHVYDERRALEIVYRALRDGGVLGVSEWAWRPGSEQLEAQLAAEMERFGTLESPYHPEYLDTLLRECGFESPVRYHAINGFFERRLGNRRLADLSRARAGETNNLTARKPSLHGTTSVDEPEHTRGSLALLQTTREDGRVRLRVRLRNEGETTWVPRAPRVGWVALALRPAPVQTAPAPAATPPAWEEIERVAPLGPNEERVVEVVVTEPASGIDWEIGIVCEHVAWLATAPLPRPTR